MKLTAHKVTNLIRDMILSGEFAAGEHMREIALAERFSVSRTPIRAALAANAKDGLLDYNPNRGYTVRSFDTRDIVEAYEMRAVLEGTACRVAAERGLKLDAERSARRAIDVVDALLEKPGRFAESSLDTWREQNLIFHQAILSQVDNHFFHEMLLLVQQIPSVYPPILVPYRHDELLLYNTQHRKILECIIDRQGTRAEFLMREHVKTACESIGDAMRERASDTEAVKALPIE